MRRSVSRRSVMVGGAAAVLTSAPALSAVASEIRPLTSAGLLTERVSQFLTMLDTQKRELANFDWDGSEWRNWNYFGVGGFIKPGLRFEQMTDSEKHAAWNILAAVLSSDGLTKAKNVMLLQDILAASGNGRGRRSSQRFSMAVFGRPGLESSWGVRLEGHHLSLSFSVHDNEIISVTPAAFAALPNRVLTGRHRGLVTLQDEEKLARQLQEDLSLRLKARAQLSDRHLFNILSAAGRERANTEKVGLAAADMTHVQREILRQLIETYAVQPYAGPLAGAQRRRLRNSDLAAAHFAWYGPNASERSFGYRIIGDSFVIELGCIDRQAQHLHPVYHDLESTLGRSS
ncbi:MAG: DUF3500 domain-containing protein [Hyphomicrobiaceae bacterium]